MQARSQDEINAAYKLLGFEPINGRFSHVTSQKIEKAYRPLTLADRHDSTSGKLQALNNAKEILLADFTVKVVTYLHNKFKYPSIQFAEIEPHIPNIVHNLCGKLKSLCTEELTSGLLIAEKKPFLKPHLGQVEIWRDMLSITGITMDNINEEELYDFNQHQFRTALEAHLRKSVAPDDFERVKTYLNKTNVLVNLMTLARNESEICSFDDSGFHFTEQLTPWLLDEKLWNLFADTGFATRNPIPIKLDKIISALKLANADKDNPKRTLYFHLAKPTLKEISPFVSKKQEWLDLKKQLITQAIDRYFELCDQPHNSEARWEKTLGERGDIAHIEQFFSESTFTVPASQYLQHVSRLCISKLEKNPAAESLLNDIFTRITSVIKDTVEKFIAAEPDHFSPIKSQHVLIHNLIDDLHEQVMDALEEQNQIDASVIAGINLEADKDLMALIDKERSRKKAVERIAARKPVISEPLAPAPNKVLALPAPEPVEVPIVVVVPPPPKEPARPVVIAAAPIASAPIAEVAEIKLDDAAPKPEHKNFFIRNARKLAIITGSSTVAGLVIGATITLLLALAPITAGATIPLAIAIGIGAAILGTGTLLGFAFGSFACAYQEVKAPKNPAPVAPSVSASVVPASLPANPMNKAHRVFGTGQSQPTEPVMISRPATQPRNIAGSAPRSATQPKEIARSGPRSLKNKQHFPLPSTSPR